MKTGEFQRTYTANLAAEMLSTSGTIISFFNWDAFEVAYGPRAPLFAQKPPARWTKAHAIEVATKFADIFVKPWGVKPGKPTAYFYWPSGSPPKMALGQRTVKWPRESRSGIPFASNGINVSVTEEYGPHSIGLGLAAEYDDVPITPVARSKAVMEGHKGLDKILG